MRNRLPPRGVQDSSGAAESPGTGSMGDNHRMVPVIASSLWIGFICFGSPEDWQIPAIPGKHWIYATLAVGRGYELLRDDGIFRGGHVPTGDVVLATVETYSHLRWVGTLDRPYTYSTGKELKTVSFQEMAKLAERLRSVVLHFRKELRDIQVDPFAVSADLHKLATEFARRTGQTAVPSWSRGRTSS